MKSIGQIAQELEAARKMADTDIEAVAPNVRPGIQVAKMQAQEALPGLKKELEEATFPSRLVGLYAKGNLNSIKETAKWMVENGGLVVDAVELYRKMAEEISQGLGTERVFGVSQYSRIIGLIREYATLLGYEGEMKAPAYLPDTICPKITDVIVHVRKYLMEVDPEFNIKNVKRQIVEGILKGRLYGPKVPVLILNMTEAETHGPGSLTSLFSEAVPFEFPRDFKPNKAQIYKAFRDFKEWEDEKVKKGEYNESMKTTKDKTKLHELIETDKSEEPIE